MRKRSGSAIGARALGRVGTLAPSSVGRKSRADRCGARRLQETSYEREERKDTARQGDTNTGRCGSVRERGSTCLRAKRGRQIALRSRSTGASQCSRAGERGVQSRGGKRARMPERASGRGHCESDVRRFHCATQSSTTHLAPMPTPMSTPQMPTRCQTLISTVAPRPLSHENHPCLRGSPFPSPAPPEPVFADLSPFSPLVGEGDCSPSAPLDSPSSVGTDSLASAGSSSE